MDHTYMRVRKLRKKLEHKGQHDAVLLLDEEFPGAGDELVRIKDGAKNIYVRFAARTIGWVGHQRLGFVFTRAQADEVLKRLTTPDVAHQIVFENVD